MCAFGYVIYIAELSYAHVPFTIRSAFLGALNINRSGLQAQSHLRSTSWAVKGFIKSNFFYSQFLPWALERKP